jgi:outer membrane protein assembly factor BamD (BamD/ComL family)
MITRFTAGLVVLAALSAPAFAGCDQAQAVDKMTKVATALGQKAGEAKTEEDSKKIVAANEKVNQGGEALGKGDYDKACSIYNAVAKENGISL